MTVRMIGSRSLTLTSPPFLSVPSLIADLLSFFLHPSRANTLHLCVGRGGNDANHGGLHDAFVAGPSRNDLITTRWGLVSGQASGVCRVTHCPKQRRCSPKCGFTAMHERTRCVLHGIALKPLLVSAHEPCRWRCAPTKRPLGLHWLQWSVTQAPAWAACGTDSLLRSHLMSNHGIHHHAVNRALTTPVRTSMLHHGECVLQRKTQVSLVLINPPWQRGHGTGSATPAGRGGRHHWAAVLALTAS